MSDELNDKQIFFLAETVRHGKGLPMNLCLDYFEGLAETMKDGPARQSALSIVNFLRQADCEMNRLLNGLIEEAPTPITPTEEKL